MPADLLRNRPDVREAALAAAMQSARLGATRRQDDLRVEDALTGYHKARDEVALWEVSASASQRAVDLAMAQYQNGAADCRSSCMIFRVERRD